MPLPTRVLRAARRGFGLPRGHVRVLSTRFGKVCLGHRSADGRHTQLRLVRVTPHTAERLDGETRWLRHLAQTHRLPVPDPLPWHDGRFVSPLLSGHDGSSWRAVACTWMPGAHLDRGLRARHFAAAGALLARVHLASVDAPAGVAEGRPTWWIPRLFSLATTLRDVVEARVAPPPGMTTALVDGLRASAITLQAAHDVLPHGAGSVGLIHTDAHWQNLRHWRHRTGLVDFEDFANGRFMLDLACLWGRVEDRRGAGTLREAMLAGYDRVRPLPAQYRRDLHVMLAFRRFDYAGWVLSWPQVDREPWGPALLDGTPAYIARALDS